MGNSLKAPRAALGLVSIAIAWACSAVPAVAAQAATATLTSTELSPTSWEYNVTLTDTGTTNVGTFWFAWVPGENFIATTPTEVAGPSSWTSRITHGGASDGYGIQWVAGAGATLAPGQSLSGFTFQSSSSPAQLAGDSPFYPGTPLLTSFVYSGKPFSDAGFQFVGKVSAVPEPSSLALMGLGLLVVGARGLRRRAVKGA